MTSLPDDIYIHIYACKKELKDKVAENGNTQCNIQYSVFSVLESASMNERAHLHVLSFLQELLTAHSALCLENMYMH